MAIVPAENSGALLQEVNGLLDADNIKDESLIIDLFTNEVLKEIFIKGLSEAFGFERFSAGTVLEGGTIESKHSYGESVEVSTSEGGLRYKVSFKAFTNLPTVFCSPVFGTNIGYNILTQESTSFQIDLYNVEDKRSKGAFNFLILGK